MFNEEEAKKKYYESIKEYIKPHIEALSVKREQLVYVNDYGMEETDKWRLELGKFIREVLFPAQNKSFSRSSIGVDPILKDFPFEMKFSSSGSRPTKKSGNRITEVFDKAVFEHLSCKEKRSSCFVVNTKDPHLYEHDCCKLIKSLGWRAKVTPGTGDQGVDVVAEKAGKKIAFQCKLYYGRLVGNAAVQQVKSGGDYLKCNAFAVISNAPYTRSAKQLASSLGVELIHHSEIAKFLSSFGVSEESESAYSNGLRFDYEKQVGVFVSAIKGDVVSVSSILDALSDEERSEVFWAAKIVRDLE